MDTLFGIAVVGVWIAISVVALKRAYGTRGPSPKSRPRGDANYRQSADRPHSM
jgi:hypothetical protein